MAPTRNRLVHYDNGHPLGFCDPGLADDDVLTEKEEDVTCRECIKRLQRWDIRCEPNRPVALNRIDWFGDDAQG